MIKRLCDICGKELEKDQGYSFKTVKFVKIYFLQRNFISYKKETYDTDEYCWDCFMDFMHCYEEYRKNKREKRK